MSETAPLLLVQAAGRDLLLSTQDLREVVAPTAVASLPGGPPGILGVVIHQGEFLPVLAWSDLPGGTPAGETAALAVLRPRLALPLERLVGTVELPPDGWRAVPEEDPWAPLMSGLGRVEGREAPLLDPDRLIALLHRLHSDR